jgi:ABC-type thiamin/hydroxymethylpyrimidine transport system permease subunit
MGPITRELYKQIKGWRIYSIVAPAVFCAVSAWLYLYYGTHFENIFYTGLIILSFTCISWWHWSLSTMVTMLAIMKDTDDHFEEVARKLEELRVQNGGRPNLKIITNTVDND